MNAVERMNHFNKNFDGDAKEIYKNMQLWHKRELPKNGVFCPSGAIVGCSKDLEKLMMKATFSYLMDKSKDDDGLMDDLMQTQFALHLIGTWRNSLGIYKIDKDILLDIVKSPVPHDTPSHIFSRLPDWGVYIEFPDVDEIFGNDNNGALSIKGFWASLDTKIVVDKPDMLVLNVTPNITFRDNQDKFNYVPIQMALSESFTVAEALMQITEIDEGIHLLFDEPQPDHDTSGHKALLIRLLPILLWLCAEEPDISNIKGEPINGTTLRAPKYGINKKTGDFVPPSQPIIFHLGKRLGGEIRTFKDRIHNSEKGVATRKRPHIRRGHWHGVWRGTGQDKNFSLYWQPAVFVNAN